MFRHSRVSGPTLIRNAKWCREHGARVECPDQQLQLAQLAAVHAHWTATVEAPTEAETGPRISAIAVESNAAKCQKFFNVKTGFLLNGSKLCKRTRSEVVTVRQRT